MKHLILILILCTISCTTRSGHRLSNDCHFEIVRTNHVQDIDCQYELFSIHNGERRLELTIDLCQYVDAAMDSTSSIKLREQIKAYENFIKNHRCK